MDSAGDTHIPTDPAPDLEAIRIAEECAHSALASSENSLVALERAEGSLLASEKRMAEVSAAAVVAAGEATEARLRAVEIATEFRILEQQVADTLGLRVRADRDGAEVPSRNGAAEPDRADRDRPVGADRDRDRPRSEISVQPSNDRAEPEGVTDFDRRRSAFERRANRVIEQLRALESGELTIRGPRKTGRSAERQPVT